MNPAVEKRPRQNRVQLAVAGLALFALWFVLCRHLSGEWSVNEQYSYGWFVPFFAAFLFWLRWEDRPEVRSRRSEVRGRISESPLTSDLRSPTSGARATALSIAAVALVILLPVRLFEVANPDWRPLEWVHAAVVVALTFVVIWFAGGKAWVGHFAFPICFIFVAVPWVTPIEEPIVQGLMRTVAALATETITLFGIPAQLEGNLIRVSTGLVGVNEACSGVRSLQTSLMIGLLFGELKRLSLAKRCLLVAGAVAIAVLANFGRALFLVWVAATENVSAVDRWHDVAGYAIVAIVFLGALGLSALLAGKRAKVESRKAKVENGASDLRTSELRFLFLLPTFYFLLFSLLWSIAVEIGVESWYRMHERDLVARERWTARWPEKAPEFREVHLDETTRRILRFDEGRGATWRVQRSEVGDRKSEEDTALLYFFRWKPGGNSALLANLHRPDVCLPASGWTQSTDYGVRLYPVSPSFSLPFRHFLFSQNRPGSVTTKRERQAHAFYCLREDRVRGNEEASLAREDFAQEPSEWSRQERLSLVKQGRRHLGQQVMEFVFLTTENIEGSEAEARFAVLVQELVERK